jgi:hypothetical protein
MWTLATAILDAGNRELQQFIARDLQEDEIGGPSSVVKTIQLSIAEQDNLRCLRVARAFLQVITHSSLLRCLSVDSYVGTIYRVFGGSNGGQGITFFSDLSGRLSQTSELPKATLALIVSALYELLRRERKCLLNDDLPVLLGSLEEKAREFESMAEDTTTTPSEFPAAVIQIGMTRRMMENACGRLQNQESGQSTTIKNAGTIQSTFPIEVVVPGGKHDNDFADATNIQIFPTLGEIMSDFAEYLPTTDFTQPSFLPDPVQRHLDCAFRLLRHDIFGPLKDMIGSVLAQTSAHSASSNPFIGGNMKAQSYSRASIQHIFIQAKVGLETVLSFTQPHQLRNQSPSDRRRWWQESSRLEPGGLVCFISTNGDEKLFMLFVVTRKSTEEVPEDQNRSSLVSKHSNPTITVKLASESQQNLALLNRMYVKKQQGLLIDLPGLIPETFVPILENLQRMMRDGDLAFRHSILPTMDGKDEQAPTGVPPPAYARRHGFKFRLSSIARDGFADLSIDPDAPFDSITPETLESATGLDHGQSQALIAALTREYALMQGPPGTGKSHVGVQLVRVLLDHKVEADLGPILVM